MGEGGKDARDICLEITKVVEQNYHFASDHTACHFTIVVLQDKIIRYISVRFFLFCFCLFLLKEIKLFLHTTSRKDSWHALQHQRTTNIEKIGGEEMKIEDII